MGAIETGKALRDAALAGGQPDALKSATQAWFDDVSSLDRTDDRISLSLAVVASAIPIVGPEAAAFLANACGALIEGGADPRPLADPLLERLTSTAARATTMSRTVLAEEQLGEDDDPAVILADRLAALGEGAPPEAADWSLLDGLLAPAVALLAADPASRVKARALATLLEAIEDVHPSAHWILRAIRVLHDEPFVAIELSSRTGIDGNFSGISENFQLNALLMDAMPRGRFLSKPRISAKAAAVARGDGPQVTDEVLTGSWNLYAWTVLAGGRGIPEPNATLSTEDWIWNEGIPADIPVFHGRRVILLGAPSYQRTWRAQRDFASLRAGIVARRLSKEEVDELLTKIGSTPRPT